MTRRRTDTPTAATLRMRRLRERRAGNVPPPEVSPMPGPIVMPSSAAVAPLPAETVTPPDRALTVQLHLTPADIEALRERGFLVDAPTPDAITAAVFGMLAEAWRAGVRAPANDDAPAGAVLEEPTAPPAPAEISDEARKREWLLRMSVATREE